MLYASKRILVPIDGSEASLRALDFGTALGRELGAQLDIVSVIDLKHVDAFDGYMMTEEQLEDLKVTVKEQVLEAARKRMPEVGPPYRARLLWGGVVEVLLREAEEEDVAMVVLGRTGKGFFGRLLEGSVSRAMAVHCRAPVIIVP